MHINKKEYTHNISPPLTTSKRGQKNKRAKAPPINKHGWVSNIKRYRDCSPYQNAIWNIWNEDHGKHMWASIDEKYAKHHSHTKGQWEHI